MKSPLYRQQNHGTERGSYCCFAQGPEMEAQDRLTSYTCGWGAGQCTGHGTGPACWKGACRKTPGAVDPAFVPSHCGPISPPHHTHTLLRDSVPSLPITADTGVVGSDTRMASWDSVIVGSCLTRSEEYILRLKDFTQKWEVHCQCIQTPLGGAPTGEPSLSLEWTKLVQ